MSGVARRLVAPLALIFIGLVGTGCGTTAATPAASGQFVEVPGIGSTRVDVPRPTSGGAECTVAIPERDTIWIDPRILTPIDDLIYGSGRRFELFQTFDQSAFLMALTAQERAALEARGWCFE